MQTYKMTLFQLGQAYVKATSKEEAVKITQTLNEDEIRWLAEKRVCQENIWLLLAEVGTVNV